MCVFRRILYYYSKKKCWKSDILSHHYLPIFNNIIVGMNEPHEPFQSGISTVKPIIIIQIKTFKPAQDIKATLEKVQTYWILLVIKYDLIPWVKLYFCTPKTSITSNFITITLTTSVPVPVHSCSRFQNCRRIVSQVPSKSILAKILRRVKLWQGIKYTFVIWSPLYRSPKLLYFMNWKFMFFNAKAEIGRQKELHNTA